MRCGARQRDGVVEKNLAVGGANTKCEASLSPTRALEGVSRVGITLMMRFVPFMDEVRD
jgi:hypothetical protein